MSPTDDNRNQIAHVKEEVDDLRRLIGTKTRDELKSQEIFFTYFDLAHEAEERAMGSDAEGIGEVRDLLQEIRNVLGSDDEISRQQETWVPPGELTREARRLHRDLKGHQKANQSLPPNDRTDFPDDMGIRHWRLNREVQRLYTVDESFADADKSLRVLEVINHSVPPSTLARWKKKWNDERTPSPERAEPTLAAQRAELEKEVNESQLRVNSVRREIEKSRAQLRELHAELNGNPADYQPTVAELEQWDLEMRVLEMREEWKARLLAEEQQRQPVVAETSAPTQTPGERERERTLAQVLRLRLSLQHDEGKDDTDWVGNLQEWEEKLVEKREALLDVIRAQIVEGSLPESQIDSDTFAATQSQLWSDFNAVTQAHNDVQVKQRTHQSETVARLHRMIATADKEIAEMFQKLEAAKRGEADVIDARLDLLKWQWQRPKLNQELFFRYEQYRDLILARRQQLEKAIRGPQQFRHVVYNQEWGRLTERLNDVDQQFSQFLESEANRYQKSLIDGYVKLESMVRASNQPGLNPDQMHRIDEAAATIERLVRHAEECWGQFQGRLLTLYADRLARLFSEPVWSMLSSQARQQWMQENLTKLSNQCKRVIDFIEENTTKSAVLSGALGELFNDVSLPKERQRALLLATDSFAKIQEEFAYKIQQFLKDAKDQLAKGNQVFSTQMAWLEVRRKAVDDRAREMYGIRINVWDSLMNPVTEYRKALPAQREALRSAENGERENRDLHQEIQWNLDELQENWANMPQTSDRSNEFLPGAVGLNERVMHEQLQLRAEQTRLDFEIWRGTPDESDKVNDSIDSLADETRRLRAQRRWLKGLAKQPDLTETQIKQDKDLDWQLYDYDEKTQQTRVELIIGLNAANRLVAENSQLEQEAKLADDQIDTLESTELAQSVAMLKQKRDATAAALIDVSDAAGKIPPLDEVRSAHLPRWTELSDGAAVETQQLEALYDRQTALLDKAQGVLDARALVEKILTSLCEAAAGLERDRESLIQQGEDWLPEHQLNDVRESQSQLTSLRTTLENIVQRKPLSAGEEALTPHEWIAKAAVDIEAQLDRHEAAIELLAGKKSAAIMEQSLDGHRVVPKNWNEAQLREEVESVRQGFDRLGNMQDDEAFGKMRRALSELRAQVLSCQKTFLPMDWRDLADLARQQQLALGRLRDDLKQIAPLIPQETQCYAQKIANWKQQWERAQAPDNAGGQQQQRLIIDSAPEQGAEVRHQLQLIQSQLRMLRTSQASSPQVSQQQLNGLQRALVEEDLQRTAAAVEKQIKAFSALKADTRLPAVSSLLVGQRERIRNLQTSLQALPPQPQGDEQTTVLNSIQKSVLEEQRATQVQQSLIANLRSNVQSSLPTDRAIHALVQSHSSGHTVFEQLDDQGQRKVNPEVYIASDADAHRQTGLTGTQLAGRIGRPVKTTPRTVEQGTTSGQNRGERSGSRSSSRSRGPT